MTWKNIMKNNSFDVWLKNPTLVVSSEEKIYLSAPPPYTETAYQNDLNYIQDKNYWNFFYHKRNKK